MDINSKCKKKKGVNLQIIKKITWKLDQTKKNGNKDMVNQDTNVYRADHIMINIS